MLKVKRKKCDQCLFSNNKVVSDSRKADILIECDYYETHFICHKSSIELGNTCCKGFYDSETSQMIRIARRLKMIEFVD